MERYIGTKRILAQPMRLGEYNAYRGWDMPADEDPAKPGFLVDIPTARAATTRSMTATYRGAPKLCFWRRIAPTGTLPSAMLSISSRKAPRSRGRDGNGRDMFLYLNPGSHDAKPPAMERGELIDGVHPDLFNNGATGTATRLPNINMRAASGATVTGWLASQTDILAEDWTIVEEAPEPAAPAEEDVAE